VDEVRVLPRQEKTLWNRPQTSQEKPGSGRPGAHARRVPPWHRGFAGRNTGGDADEKERTRQRVRRVLTGCSAIPPEAEQGMLRIWRVWDRVVGEDIARNARPAAFKGSILLVHVTSSTWLHHLQYLKKDIVAQLNNDLDQAIVGDIKFKIGSF
jgi:predicted nucleic acid-binding Zn ribbon protein